MDNVNTIICAVSISAISEILGIVVTCVLVVYWLFMLGLKIFEVAKDGKLTRDELDEVKDLSQEVEQQVEQASDKIKGVQSTEQGETK